ncbi:MAG: M16 family metallopeptidase [Armatimonadota bacterium]
MKASRLSAALALVMVLGVACKKAPADQPGAETLTLANGIRVLVLRFPGSTNASIFTYVPMGLAADGPGQTQWSHLVEHLVIRTTVPLGSQEANAETLPDHMRLDFYGTTANWEEGLSHHARWLEGIAFTEESLAAEKPLVNSECDTVAARQATHKFAMAAWAQGYRCGRTHAAVKGDIERAKLSEIQQYRDGGFAVLDRAVVCIVGGLDAKTVQPAVTDALGKLTSEAKLPGPVEAPGGSRDMTWDLEARHIALTWPIPGVGAGDYPALLVASQLLMMQLFQDQELKALTGMALAGADLTTPEGSFLCVSASLQPGASFEAVRGKLEQHVAALRSGEQSASQAPQFGRQLSQSMTSLPDPAMLAAQAPPNMTQAMIEANVGLQYAMHEYRYGAHKQAVADALAAITASDVQKAAEQYLTPEKRAVCTLRRG